MIDAGIESVKGIPFFGEKCSILHYTRKGLPVLLTGSFCSCTFNALSLLTSRQVKQRLAQLASTQPRGNLGDSTPMASPLGYSDQRLFFFPQGLMLGWRLPVNHPTSVPH
jgi:hypothetical protein